MSIMIPLPAVLLIVLCTVAATLWVMIQWLKYLDRKWDREQEKRAPMVTMLRVQLDEKNTDQLLRTLKSAQPRGPIQ